MPGYNFAFIGDVAHYHTAARPAREYRSRAACSTGRQRAGAGRRPGRCRSRHAERRRCDLSGCAGALAAAPAAALGAAAVRCRLSADRAGGLSDAARAACPAAALAGGPDAAAAAGGLRRHGLCAAWPGGLDFAGSPIRPLPIRLAAAVAGVRRFGVALLAARGAGGIACWLWFAGLAIVCAIWAPALAPYFLFPSLVAAPLLLATVRAGAASALFVAALAALVIWIGFNAGGEAIMGLKMHPLFTLTRRLRAAGAAAAAGPAQTMGLGLRRVAGAGAGAGGDGGPAAGLQRRAPQRLNLRYVEQDGKAWWLADPVRASAATLARRGAFLGPAAAACACGYVAPAGARAISTAVGRGHAQRRHCDLRSQCRRRWRGACWCRKEAGLQSVTLGGVTVPADGRRV